MGRLMERIKDGAREDLKDAVLLDPDLLHPRGYIEDRIHEYADSAVPVYTADLMELFTEDPGLAFVEPELGHGNAGDNMVGKAQAIVYEAVTEDLHEYLIDLRDAWEEYEDERDRLALAIEEQTEELADAESMDPAGPDTEALRSGLEDLETELEGLSLEDFIA